MPRKKEEVTGGLPTPNCFIVPTDILQAINKLSKEEIVCLLNVLAGRDVSAMSDSFGNLQAYGICNLMGEIIWQPPTTTHIRIVKPQKVYAVKVTEDQDPQDLQGLIDSLPERVSSLWGYQKQWFKEKSIPVTDAHMGSWFNHITELQKEAGFNEAVEMCHKSKIGSPKVLKQYMDSIGAKSGSDWGSYGS